MRSTRGAQRIEVELERGGCGLIRVRDDGAGIDAAEISWRWPGMRPARSPSLDDLESVATLGFRGEALPSIASISRLSLVSRTASASHAWAVGGPRWRDRRAGTGGASAWDQRRGARSFLQCAGAAQFLRTEKTEYQHIVRMLERLALSRFDVAFTLAHNGKNILDAWGRRTARRAAGACGEHLRRRVRRPRGRTAP